MKLLISQNAFQELKESQDYYNLQQENLGNIFKNDIQKAINSIQNFPNLYPNITETIKRCLLHRFPFSIFYSVHKDTIIILSIAHQHRKPQY